MTSFVPTNENGAQEEIICHGSGDSKATAGLLKKLIDIYFQHCFYALKSCGADVSMQWAIILKDIKSIIYFVIYDFL